MFRQWFYENKEGLIGGAILGTVLFFMWIKTNNPNILLEVAKKTSGWFDSFRTFPIFSNMDFITFLLVKIWLGFIAVGMFVGAIADMLLPERIL